MLTIDATLKMDVAKLLRNHHSGVNPLRQMDVDETVSLTGKTVGEVLWKHVRTKQEGIETFTYLDEQGSPLGIFGVYPVEHPEGDPKLFGWFIATEALQARGKEAHKLAREFFRGFPHPLYAVTTNRHLDKWHKAMGFRHVQDIQPGLIPLRVYYKE